MPSRSHEGRRRDGFAGAASALLVLFLGGCDLPPRPTLQRKVDRGPRIDPIAMIDELEAEQRLDALDPPAHPVPQDYRAGYVIRTSPLAPGGVRDVGMRQILGRPDEENVEVTDRSRLWIGQNDLTLVREVMVRETLATDGTLVALEASRSLGPIVHDARARVADRQLVVEGSGIPAARPTRWAWGPDDRGTQAVLQSLLNSPMTSEDADYRTIRGIGIRQYGLPLLMPPHMMELRREGVAAGEDASGKRMRLTEIEVEHLPDPGQGEKFLDSLWIDSDGDPIRIDAGDGLSELRLPPGEPLRRLPLPNGHAAITPRGDEGTIEKWFAPVQASEAMDLVAMRWMDLQMATGGEDSGEQPDGSADDDERLSNPKIAFRIPSCPGQSVRDRDGVWQVILHQVGDENPNFEAFRSIPDGADTAVTDVANSNDAELRRIASASMVSVTPDRRRRDVEVGDLDLLAGTVRSLVDLEREPRGVQSAADLLRLARADSLGTSVLMAALARFNGIPTRIAVGVRKPKSSRPTDAADASPAAPSSPPLWLHFHAWNVCFVQGRWYVVDASDEDWTSGETWPCDRVCLRMVDVNRPAIEAAITDSLDMLSRARFEVLAAR